MSNNIIEVENLTKTFRINNGIASSDRYLALRDVIANKFSYVFSNISQITKKEQEKQIEQDFTALDDISFSIKEGDRVGIIGRNGAGKSTLLKILSRITEPSKGKVRLKGRVASLLEVGTGFHPELTGRENIFLNGAILGMSRVEIKRKFDEIVDFAQIEKFLDTPVKRYSSGMYVRLAFAVAAHLEPEILIIDEVLAVGDMEFQRKCLGKMEDVSNNSGRTVLFVSHDLAAIEFLTQKCILLNKGALIGFGNTREILNSYQNLSSSTNNSLSDFFNKRSLVSSKAKITGLYINNISSDFVSVSTNYLSVVLEFSVFERIMVGYYVLIRHMGKPIYWFDSGHLTGYIQNLTTGKYLAELVVPKLNLASGSYTLSIGIHQPNVEWYDLVPDVVVIEIPFFSPGSNGFNYEVKFGVSLPEFEWKAREA